MDQELHILIQISVYYEAPPLVLLLDANHNENETVAQRWKPEWQGHS